MTHTTRILCVLLALHVALVHAASVIPEDTEISPYDGWTWTMNGIFPPGSSCEQGGFTNQCQTCYPGYNNIPDAIFNCTSTEVTMLAFSTNDGSCEGVVKTKVFPMGCSKYYTVQLNPPPTEDDYLAVWSLLDEEQE